MQFFKAEHISTGITRRDAKCPKIRSDMSGPNSYFQLHAFFFISNTFISNTRLKMDKSLAKFKQNPEAQEP